MMNISGLTTNGILKMYNAIREALEIDDNIPEGQEKVYGVREFADWRETARRMEAELDKRSVTYTKISW